MGKKIKKNKVGLVSSDFRFRAEEKKVTSRAELKILQLKFWLEPARLGLITTILCPYRDPNTKRNLGGGMKMREKKNSFLFFSLFPSLICQRYANGEFSVKKSDWMIYLSFELKKLSIGIY